MKVIKIFLSLSLVVLLGILACQRQTSELNKEGTLGSKPSKTKLDAPILSCSSSSQGSIDLQVCAGETGAPAGFSIQWMKQVDYIANGSVWPSDETLLCHASFSGNANGSRYNLGANECVTVRIGDLLFDNGTSASCIDELFCGTAYVFRAFAHAGSTISKSDLSAIRTCTTMPCASAIGCTYTQGYWKTHGPLNCNPSSSGNTWPVSSLMLGNVTYDQDQLCSIFNTPAAGNQLLSLAHQLIAAKLNIASGADGTAINASIAAADALIGNLVIPPVGSGTLSNVSALITALDDYNLGITGPGHCQ